MNSATDKRKPRVGRRRARSAALCALVAVGALPWIAGRAEEAEPVDSDLFSKRVLPLLRSAGCPACHAEQGLARETRLRFPPEDASEKELRSFALGLRALVDAANPAESLLLVKPTLRTPHTGGRLIEPGSDRETTLRQWAEWVAELGPPEEAARAPSGQEWAQRERAPRTLRRLTHSQYNNTVRDLLGDQSRIADQFPPEDFVNGFKNQSQAQDIPPLLAGAYSAAAEKLARNAFRGGDRQALIPCEPSSPEDLACAEEFIRSFGRRAFRRPLLPFEVDRFSRLFVAEASATGEFVEGARLVVEVILQSPKFLFHLDDPDGPWASYARANSLAYFLWNTLPDQELLAVAEAGGLDSLGGVERQTRRMLRDPRAREAMAEFFSQWLRLDLALNAVRDRRLYPEFSPELALNMAEETRRLIDDVVWNGKDFREVFTVNYTFLNSELAKLYGLPAPENEFDRVELPADAPRAGLLGQAAFLTLTSKPGETSPTARGLFVREHFLCEKIPDPPPEASATLPPLTEDKPLSNRELLNAHLTNPTCASCHNLIDPVGFGLEKFGPIGRYRERQAITFFPTRAERDKDPVTVEVDINPIGWLSGVSVGQFSSPRELGELLAESSRCQECIVRQLFRYATGRMEEPADRQDIEEAEKGFRESGFQFQELILALTKTSAFLGEARLESTLADAGEAQ